MPSSSTSSTDSGFGTFSLQPSIQRGIDDLRFDEPRPIQAKTIPAALAGQDILGLAQTGTGKTAAFALPILQRLSTKRGRNPRALIVAPTRELATQIHAEVTALGRHTGLKVATIYGGVSASPQIRALRSGVDIIVACPGRLLDLYRQKIVRLDAVEVLVLDEADHMFDMGFLPDVRRILQALPAERQNLLFSATMPREVRALADETLHQPHVVELSHSKPAETIEHVVYPVAKAKKFELLLQLLNDRQLTSAIVFSRTKHLAKRLARQLDAAGHQAVALQGNMSQPQRTRAMAGFRRGQFKVLVATDIAARGIDVAGVSHVINYDVPGTPDAYTHRIGRTGRAEQDGKAYTFISEEDNAALRGIERHLGEKIPKVQVPGFEPPARIAASNSRPIPRHRPTAARPYNKQRRRPGARAARRNPAN